MRWNWEAHVRQKSPATVEPNCLLTSFCMCHSAATTHTPRDARTADGTSEESLILRSFKNHFSSIQWGDGKVYLSAGCRISARPAERTEAQWGSRAPREPEGRGKSEAPHRETHDGHTERQRGLSSQHATRYAKSGPLNHITWLFGALGVYLCIPLKAVINESSKQLKLFGQLLFICIILCR